MPVSVGDADKAAEIITDVIVNSPPTADNIALYKLVCILIIVIVVLAICFAAYLFYKSITGKIDRGKARINKEFEKVKANCDLKDRRLTTVETKVSDMRSNLDLTTKDMIEYKAETEVRVGNLEKVVDEKLMPKLDLIQIELGQFKVEISSSVGEILGKLDSTNSK